VPYLFDLFQIFFSNQFQSHFILNSDLKMRIAKKAKKEENTYLLNISQLISEQDNLRIRIDDGLVDLEKTLLHVDVRGMGRPDKHRTSE
jgi:hypothetical protein